MRIQLLAILCTAVFTTGLIYDSAVYLNYLMHQNEITELFCVNKDEPEMQCNGKCHLKDMLKKDQDDSEKRAPREFKFEQLTVIEPESKPDLRYHGLFSTSTKFTEFQAPLSCGYLSIETPPPRYSAFV